MDKEPKFLLIIDDDKELCSLLKAYLEREGYEVEVAHNGEEGIEKALSRGYSLLILDVMQPGRLSGFDVLHHLRAKSAMPIMMISARAGDIDRIIGLEMGADDYLPKPFDAGELLARIRSILRRAGSIIMEVAVGGRVLRYKGGDIELDSGTRVVYSRNEPVELTAVEFDLLKALLRNAGQTVTREELAKEVLDRTISTKVSTGMQ